MPRIQDLLRRASPILIVAIAACSDSNGPSGRAMSLSFAATAPAAGAVANVSTTRPTFDITLTDASHRLVITSAQLVLREVELQLPLTADCQATETDDSPECAELDVGPMLVSLPVDGASTTTPLTVSIPAGTYHEIEFRLREPDDDAAGNAFAAQNPAFADIALQIVGTYDGEPFTFTSRLDAKMELEFATPIVIADGANNVTVDVDLDSWFRDAGGALIDPRTATSGSTARLAIENNIVSSFSAFEDDDRDGHDDHGGHDGETASN